MVFLNEKVILFKNFYVHCSTKYIVRLFCDLGKTVSSETLREKCPYSELFWSESGKKRARKTPNTDTFYTVK